VQRLKRAACKEAEEKKVWEKKQQKELRDEHAKNRKEFRALASSRMQARREAAALKAYEEKIDRAKRACAREKAQQERDERNIKNGKLVIVNEKRLRLDAWIDDRKAMLRARRHYGADHVFDSD